jgi:hypothetical protein
VHRVPTGFFDLQILVPDGQVADAANAICANLPYVTLNGDAPDSHWHDYKIHSPDRPHAFILTPKGTFVLRHSDSNPPCEEVYTLIHSFFIRGLISSFQPLTFHFDITVAFAYGSQPKTTGRGFRGDPVPHSCRIPRRPRRYTTRAASPILSHEVLPSSANLYEASLDSRFYENQTITVRGLGDGEEVTQFGSIVSNCCAQGSPNTTCLIYQ